MEIELNGVAHQLDDSQTLQQLVAALAMSGKAIAVAVNRQVVPAHLWSQHVLLPADKVDLVRAIGGG